MIHKCSEQKKKKELSKEEIMTDASCLISDIRMMMEMPLAGITFKTKKKKNERWFRKICRKSRDVCDSSEVDKL